MGLLNIPNSTYYTEMGSTGSAEGGIVTLGMCPTTGIDSDWFIMVAGSSGVTNGETYQFSVSAYSKSFKFYLF